MLQELQELTLRTISGMSAGMNKDWTHEVVVKVMNNNSGFQSTLVCPCTLEQGQKLVAFVESFITHGELWIAPEDAHLIKIVERLLSPFGSFLVYSPEEHSYDDWFIEFDEVYH